jgi:hypothetical protein
MDLVCITVDCHEPESAPMPSEVPIERSAPGLP